MLPLASAKFYMVSVGSEMVGKHNGIIVLMGPRSQVLGMLFRCLKKPKPSLPYETVPQASLVGQRAEKVQRVRGADQAQAATLGNPLIPVLTLALSQGQGCPELTLNLLAPRAEVSNRDHLGILSCI